LSVSTAATQNFDMERFNLKKPNDTAIEELITSWNLKQISNFLILGTPVWTSLGSGEVL